MGFYKNYNAILECWFILYVTFKNGRVKKNRNQFVLSSEKNKI